MQRSSAPSLEYGFMNTRLESLEDDILALEDSAGFLEVQIHDKLLGPFSRIGTKVNFPDSFSGYVTLHGEGETDGRRRIQFCSPDNSERQRYISNCLTLYETVIDHLKGEVRRVILHPDSLASRTQKQAQIQLLAASLADLQDKLSKVQVCIEPRGGFRQKKVLQSDMKDILSLGNHLSSLGASNRIGLCIDLAQSVIVHGNQGTVTFLDNLRSINLRVQELHLSDVAVGQNRVAAEVGKGRVDWANILPAALKCCKAILIETLGGVKVFRRSKGYLQDLVNPNEILL